MLPANRKNASGIWSVMTRTAPGTARCNICNQVFKCDKGTSNLLRHVKKKHEKPEDLSLRPTVDDPQPGPSKKAFKPLEQMTIFTSIERVAKYRPDTDKKKVLDRKLLAMVYRDMQPFSIVEDHGFRDFCNNMDARYELPSRRQLKRSLQIEYAEVKEGLIGTLCDVESVAITTDSWTSVNMESFLTITAHFLEPPPSWKLRSTVLATRPEGKYGSSAAGMAEIINEVLEEFKIQEKITAATTDNASAMVCLVRDYLKVLHVRCFAQTLNLVVKEGIKSTEGLSSLIADVKGIVNFFHKSAKATFKLKQVQVDMGMKEFKLCQEVATRWNSSLKMIKRYIQLHRAVSGALAALGRVDLLISDRDVSQMKEFCESLEPFEEATILMSTEKRTSLSQIMVVVRQLQHFLDNEVTPTTLGSNLQRELSLRFPNPEDNFTGAAATLLDPRFKRLPFSDENLRKRHEERIINMMRPLFSTADEESTETETPAFFLTPTKKSFMESFVARAKEADKAAPEHLTGPREEFQRYMGLKYLDLKKDPIIWWQEHAAQFPHLGTIARKFIFIPATSVPSERLFSKAGELVSKKRNCLNATTIDMVLFLNKQE